MGKRRRYSLPDTNQTFTAAGLKKLPREQQIEIMRGWFHDNFNDPNELPYNSGEGGFQWIWGGPYYPEDQLESEFEGSIPDDVIRELSSDLSDVSYTWSGKPGNNDQPNDYFDELNSHLLRPFEKLMISLGQIDQVAARMRKRQGESFLHRLLYANVISALETYLGDAFASWIFADDDLVERFVRTNPAFRSEKISLSEVIEKFKTIDKRVKSYLSNVVWHRLGDAAGLYKTTFGIHFLDDIRLIKRAIKDRHDIVHRNGKSVDGAEGQWGLAEIRALIKEVERFAGDIEENLNATPWRSESPPESI
jgi:hypothetical protein